MLPFNVKDTCVSSPFSGEVARRVKMGFQLKTQFLESSQEVSTEGVRGHTETFLVFPSLYHPSDPGRSQCTLKGESIGPARRRVFLPSVRRGQVRPSLETSR